MSLEVEHQAFGFAMLEKLRHPNEEVEWSLDIHVLSSGNKNNSKEKLISLLLYARPRSKYSMCISSFNRFVMLCLGCV